MPQAALTTLAHHIDIDWLREAYRRTRKNGHGRGPANGREYASNLELNLRSLLDEWFVRQVAPRLVGPAVLVRYADDVVIIFGNEQDARRVFDVLPKRFAKYGLTLHPQKTRLVDFRRPDRRALALPDNGDVRWTALKRKVAGALWVLRYHRKLPGASQFLSPCHRCLAKVERNDRSCFLVYPAIRGGILGRSAQGRALAS